MQGKPNGSNALNDVAKNMINGKESKIISILHIIKLKLI